MITSKKLGSLAVGLIMSTGMLTGTAFAGQQTSVQKITFWDMEWGGPAYIKEGQALVAQFNKTHPNIQVTYQSIPWNNWYQTFASALASGTGPDVSSGAGYQAFQFAQSGEILNLAPVVADWKKNGVIKQYPSSEISALQYKGTQVAIPWNVDIRVLYYNKATFAQHHLSPPTNWTQFYSDAVKLTGNGKYGFGIGGDTLGSHNMYFFMLDNGGGLFTKSGQPNFAQNPKNVQALQFLHKLAEANALDPAGPGWNSTQLQTAFTRGDVAMMLNGPGMTTSLPPAVAKHTGIIPLLTSPNGSKGTVYWINNLMAYKSSKYPTADYAFLEWWSAHLLPLVQPNGIIPANTSMQRTNFYQNNPYLKTILKDYLPYAKTTAAYDPHLFPQLNAIEGAGALMNLAQMVTQKLDVNTMVQKTNADFTKTFSGQ